MSVASLQAFVKLTGARFRLQRIRDGLRLVAGGKLAEDAAQEIGDAFNKIVHDKYQKHQTTGALDGSAHVAVSASLITIHRYGYARYHRWDPLRRSSIPPFMLKIAQQIASAKLLAYVRGEEAAGRFTRTTAAIGLSEAEDVEAETRADVAKRASKSQERQWARESKRLSPRRKPQRKVKASA